MVEAVHLLQGPMTAFAVLLGIGGAAKLWRPEGAVRAIQGLRLPAGRLAVRALAAAEVAIAIGAVVFGTWTTSLLVALSYLGFCGFIVLARADFGSISSCGCFGTADTRPTGTHLFVTVAAAAVALATIVQPVGPLFPALGRQPIDGLPFLVLTGCCVWFGYAALAILPRSSALVRPR
jgi:hypothetical protein